MSKDTALWLEEAKALYLFQETSCKNFLKKTKIMLAFFEEVC